MGFWRRGFFHISANEKQESPKAARFSVRLDEMRKLSKILLLFNIAVSCVKVYGRRTQSDDRSSHGLSTVSNMCIRGKTCVLTCVFQHKRSHLDVKNSTEFSYQDPLLQLNDKLVPYLYIHLLPRNIF